MSWSEIQSSGTNIDYVEWNAMVGDLKAEWISGNYKAHKADTDAHHAESHTNSEHDENYYYQESDLTAVLNDNYAPSGISGDASSQVTLASGLVAISGLYHDGDATTMYLNDVPQVVLKSGASYWKGYLSGQNALTTIDAIDLYYSSSLGKSLSDFSSNAINLYYSSSLGENVSTAYAGHAGNDGIHFTVNQIKDDFYPSGLGLELSGAYYTHAANTGIHFTKESLDDNYHPSGLGEFAYVSSQYISGQLLALHQARDITGWDSASFTNSGIIWNGTAWEAMPSGGSGGGGAVTLEELTDTTISTPTSGNSLTYDGTTWIDLNVKGVNNLEGGTASTIYGGVVAFDCGGA